MYGVEWMVVLGKIVIEYCEWFQLCYCNNYLFDFNYYLVEWVVGGEVFSEVIVEVVLVGCKEL